MPSTQDHIKERLQQMLRTLDGRLRSEASGEAATQRAHDPNIHTQVTVAAFDEGLLTALFETSRHIRAALKRLDEGEYGICVECGVVIPDNRMMALPFAVLCRLCQQLTEEAKTGRQSASGYPALLSNRRREW